MNMFKKKVALCDIAKIEKSQIFVLFENDMEPHMKISFLATSVLSYVTNAVYNIFSQNLI